MQSKKLVIGITGGIGSGKSIACKYFEKLGYEVIYADKIAKELYRTSGKLRGLLVKEFGRGILGEDGRISLDNARKIIFSKTLNLHRVNSIVHPFVIREIATLLNRSRKKIIIIETAIMFESGYSNRVDYVVLIYSKKSLRKQRVKQRDKLKSVVIDKIIAQQMDEREKRKRADFIIRNNSTPAALYKNIRSFSKILKVLNKKNNSRIH